MNILSTLKNDVFVLGCSGGPDSMALLDMMRKKGLNLVVVHVNYYKRDTSLYDQSLVMNYCDKYQIKCHCFDGRNLQEGNFQQAARNFRYEKYQEVYFNYQAAGLLLAHHQDDQIETALFQLLSNRQPLILGMESKSVRMGMIIYRPLLDESKQDLLDYCESHHLDYALDESNFQPVYTRNKIRLAMQEFTEEQRQMVLDYIKVYRRRNQIVKKQVDTYFRKNQNIIDISTYSVLESNLRLAILRQYLSNSDVDVYKMSRKFLAELDRLILDENNHTIDLNPYSRFVIEYNRAEIWPKQEYDYVYELSDIEYLSTPYFKTMHIGPKSCGMTLNEQDFPITIRNAQSADRIKMRFGTKKVSRFFIDRKIPREARRMWPVVVNSEGEIIYVYGLGCDVNHYSAHHNYFLIKY